MVKSQRLLRPMSDNRIVGVSGWHRFQVEFDGSKIPIFFSDNVGIVKILAFHP